MHYRNDSTKRVRMVEREIEGGGGRDGNGWINIYLNLV